MCLMFLSSDTCVSNCLNSEACLVHAIQCVCLSTSHNYTCVRYMRKVSNECQSSDTVYIVDIFVLLFSLLFSGFSSMNTKTMTKIDMTPVIPVGPVHIHKQSVKSRYHVMAPVIPLQYQPIWTISDHIV